MNRDRTMVTIVMVCVVLVMVVLGLSKVMDAGHKMVGEIAAAAGQAQSTPTVEALEKYDAGKISLDEVNAYGPTQDDVNEYCETHTPKGAMIQYCPQS